MKSMSESYKAAGVDITAGYKAVELMKQHIAKTMTAGALSDIGGFGGLFELDITGMERPVLVSGTDGVGTKLKLAFIMDKHDTIGIDCVAMCVNDIICCGAKPLFFLDYIACGKNVPEKIAEIVKGVAEGCVQSGAALIGGETAEMPGFYGIDEYDLAGFSVGVVDRKKVFDNTQIKEAHPNTALLDVEGVDGKTIVVQASSLGGGRIMLNELDEITVNCTGACPTLIIRNEDSPGQVAEVTSVLYGKKVNIATLQLHRDKRGGYAVMVIETDQPVEPDTIRDLERLNGISKVTYIETEGV